MRMAKVWTTRLCAVLLLVGAGTLARAEGSGKKPRQADLVAERAGWFLGMYLGEERGNPYPFVLEVTAGSDAALDGVKPGDEVIRVEDEEVGDLKALLKRGSGLRPGRQAEVWVRRGSQTLQFRITVPAKPNGEAVAKESKPGKESADAEKSSKKKSKKKPPVVIKPIPTPDR